MDLVTLASEIVDARCLRRFVMKPSSRFPSFRIADGYDLGAMVSRSWVGRDHVPCGIKLGLTYREVWPSLGISAPVWAPVYADTLSSDDTAHIRDLRAPRIEAEMMVGIGTDLAPGASLGDVERAVAWAALGFELVDCHYPSWDLTAADLIADFGCHAGLVVSSQCLDVEASTLRELRIELRCNGELVARGNGEYVVGGPIEAIHAALASPRAPGIKEGQVVATGALTRRSHPVRGVQTWELVPDPISNFDPITMRIEA
jgi:2-oxo-3-hexenedioate decarboxylase